MEILVESHKDCVDEMKLIVQEQMVKSFNYYAPSVPMEVDAAVGTHWIH
jgi:DNA polymerase I-like protein with 3'-5' exonuclease and polymerase domains